MSEDALIPAELPNDSTALGVYEPELDTEAQEDERKERGVAASGVPILEDIMTWFDDMIDGSDSVAQAKTTMKTYDCSADTAIAAHDIVASLLQTKRDEIEARIKAFYNPDSEEEEDE